ncbi:MULTISPECIES: aminoglycoside phosphotransferase family protein [unclassified Bacillus (in: firmicutes)]|uniref:aminoglycoside phosphotransferase family protein n=1 Tax=unclassified Bacillus (in: firmicutes) TaxID=185979 RepID=UPI0015971586|nr:MULTISPECIES: aminoglycoside phosphotransferase family protein [unclassified Bacillus (in: firmicutes)]
MNKYNISEVDFLGKGQEAEVYSYDQTRVLKLYKPTAYSKLEILKQFYESMNSSDANFELPKIHEIIKEKDVILTIEKRIEGKNIQKDLSNYDEQVLDSFFENYLSTIVSIQKIELEEQFKGIKLLSDYDEIYTKDWNDFLKQSLLRKNTEVDRYLKRDVLDYEVKLKRLMDAFSVGYEGEYALVHGDYYPSNLLVNSDGRINGVIDFGLMTLYGDPLFDVALSWILFDLYDELGEIKLEKYLNKVVNQLGEEVRSTIYLYVLFYSIYSANFFSETCSDGHYQWSVRNLNNEKFWAALEN